MIGVSEGFQNQKQSLGYQMEGIQMQYLIISSVCLEKALFAADQPHCRLIGR